LFFKVFKIRTKLHQLGGPCPSRSTDVSTRQHLLPIFDELFVEDSLRSEVDRDGLRIPASLRTY
jgi:hypothetical protein